MSEAMNSKIVLWMTRSYFPPVAFWFFSLIEWVKVLLTHWVDFKYWEFFRERTTPMIDDDSELRQELRSHQHPQNPRDFTPLHPGFYTRSFFKTSWSHFWLSFILWSQSKPLFKSMTHGCVTLSSLINICRFLVCEIEPSVIRGNNIFYLAILCTHIVSVLSAITKMKNSAAL